MTMRDELIEAAARAFLNAIREEESMLCYVDSDPQLDAVMIDGDVDMYRAMGAALDAILGRLTAFIGDRALAYDKQADAEKDGTRKMQGATLAVLANDLVALSTLARHDRV